MAPGPVFIHAAHCDAYEGAGFPDALRGLPLAFEARGSQSRVTALSSDPHAARGSAHREPVRARGERMAAPATCAGGMFHRANRSRVAGQVGKCGYSRPRPTHHKKARVSARAWPEKPPRFPRGPCVTSLPRAMYRSSRSSRQHQRLRRLGRTAIAAGTCRVRLISIRPAWLRRRPQAGRLRVTVTFASCDGASVSRVARRRCTPRRPA